MLFILRDIQVAPLGIQIGLFERHSGCPFWGIFRLSLLEVIQVGLFRDNQVALFDGHSCSFL